MKIQLVSGDLLDQDVDAIVNPWNRNVIPWWLLLPQGVSGAIRRRAGWQPFRELGRLGPIPLGGAVETSAGRLPFRSIIHVAGINLWWQTSHPTIADCVRNAVHLAQRRGFTKIGLPLIGAGTGGGAPDAVEAVILATLATLDFEGEVLVVRYTRTQQRALTAPQEA